MTDLGPSQCEYTGYCVLKPPTGVLKIVAFVPNLVMFHGVGFH